MHTSPEADRNLQSNSGVFFSKAFSKIIKVLATFHKTFSFGYLES